MPDKKTLAEVIDHTNQSLQGVIEELGSMMQQLPEDEKDKCVEIITQIIDVRLDMQQYRVTN